MTVQIILIRHGIAEDRAHGQSDFDRKLTEKGRQRLFDTLPQLWNLLGDGQAQIWSSPLVRAIETSQIAADIFHIKKTVRCDFISEGYFSGFLKAVEELESAVNHVILVIGHEPDMGYWSKALCGAFLPFKKGAAAGFLYSGGESGAADLQWFFQPETMEMLSKRDESGKIPDDIRDILQVHMRQIHKEYGNVSKGQSNPETVHRLRVSLRILRSLLAFLKPFMNDKQNASVQQTLKKLLAELSCLRELDVLRETYETFIKINPCNTDISSFILDMLDEERRKEAARSIAAVSGADSIVSLHDALRSLEKPEWKKNIDEDESIKARLNDRFMEQLQEFRQSAAAVNYDDAEAVHALRIDAKKLRYVLDSLAQTAGIQSGIIGAELSAAHKNLGQICDARCNKSILQKYSTRELPEHVHEEFLKIIDNQDRIIEAQRGLLKEYSIHVQ